MVNLVEVLCVRKQIHIQNYVSSGKVKLLPLLGLEGSNLKGYRNFTLYHFNMFPHCSA